MWWEIAYGSLGAGMVLAGGARIWWARRQPMPAPAPSFDESTWNEAAAVLGTPVHDYETAERARALDDRHPNKLAAIAADLEREARPSVADLLAERFGRRGGERR